MLSVELFRFCPPLSSFLAFSCCFALSLALHYGHAESAGGEGWRLREMK